MRWKRARTKPISALAARVVLLASAGALAAAVVHALYEYLRYSEQALRLAL